MRKLDTILDLIRGAEHIALVCHLSPDGDAMGSMLGMRLGLEKMGKQVSAFCQDPVPRNLTYLPGSECVQGPAAVGTERYDLLLALDCADLERIGECSDLQHCAAHTAQVDHHGTNPRYFEASCVDSTASATVLICYEMLTRLGVEIDRDIATCLYTGLSTDTGNFAFSCTTKEAFQVAGELLEKGAPTVDIVRRMFRVKEKPAVMLLERALRSIQFYADGEVTVTTITSQDLQECGALREHSDGIVNQGLDITGVKLTCMLREDAPGDVKAGFRAVDGYRVDQIASSFGGGGHPLASGASLAMPLEEARQRVVEALTREAVAHRA